MTRWIGLSLALALALGAVPSAAEDPVVQDLLDILKDRGIVDEGQYTELSAKSAAWEEEHERLLGRIEFSGDFRFRLENYWYDRDELGDDRDDRTRLRYRLRLRGDVAVNEYVNVVFRLVSGEAVNFDEGANRSTNRTLGRGFDFSYDPVFLDLAYIELVAPSEWLPGAKAELRGGKVANPFRWKIGKDFLFWDPDITPEGVAATGSYALSERWKLFLNTGYFIFDENATAADPHVFGIQGGVHGELGGAWRAGGRLPGPGESLYERP